MKKEGLLIPCPFYAGKYCSEVCPNFYQVLEATAKEAAENDKSFTQVVEDIVRVTDVAGSFSIMKFKHPEVATSCSNNPVN